MSKPTRRERRWTQPQLLQIVAAADCCCCRLLLLQLQRTNSTHVTEQLMSVVDRVM